MYFNISKFYTSYHRTYMTNSMLLNSFTLIFIFHHNFVHLYGFYGNWLKYKCRILYIKIVLLFLSPITSSVCAAPVPCAVHTMQQNEELGLSIHFPTSQLTFYDHLLLPLPTSWLWSSSSTCLIRWTSMFSSWSTSVHLGKKCLATSYLSLPVLISLLCTLNPGLKLFL